MNSNRILMILSRYVKKSKKYMDITGVEKEKHVMSMHSLSVYFVIVLA